MNKKKKTDVKKKEKKLSHDLQEGLFLRNVEDEKNVDEFLAGNREAFGDLFKRYRNDVYKIAYRFTNNHDDSMEITQEVFLKIMSRLQGFNKGSHFFTWLYRIAVNHSIDFLRRGKRKKSFSLEEEKIPTRRFRSDPVKLAEHEEMVSRFKEGFAQLSENQKAVLTMHGFEHLSYKEIAVILGCSYGTVMSRLFYARKKIAEILGKTKK